MEWHVWDFPDNIYVKFTERFRIKLFILLKNVCGSRAKLAKELGYDTTTIKGFLQKGHDSEGHQMYTPVKLIKKIPEILSCSFDSKIMKELERNIVAYRSRAGLSTFNPKLPIKETSELYSIMAHMVCDGSAGKGKTPTYYNTCKELREKFKRDLQIFGDTKTNEYLVHSKVLPVYGVMFPKAITDILSYIFRIRFVRTSHLPKLLFNAPKNCQYTAIRAMFDDEGTFSSLNQLTFTSAEFGLINDLKLLLKQNSIKTGKICTMERSIGTLHYLTVLSESREEFKKLVGFTHPRKSIKLRSIVKNDIKRKNYISLSTKVLELLQKENPLTRFEISKKLNISINSVTDVMYKLRRKGKVRSCFNAKNQPYLWIPTKAYDV